MRVLACACACARVWACAFVCACGCVVCVCIFWYVPGHVQFIYHKFQLNWKRLFLIFSVFSYAVFSYAAMATKCIYCVKFPRTRYFCCFFTWILIKIVTTPSQWIVIFLYHVLFKQVQLFWRNHLFCGEVGAPNVALFNTGYRHHEVNEAPHETEIYLLYCSRFPSQEC